MREEFPDKKDKIEEIVEKEAFNSLIEFLSEDEKEIIIDKIIQQIMFEERSEEMKKPLGTIKNR